MAIVAVRATMLRTMAVVVAVATTTAVVRLAVAAAMVAAEARAMVMTVMLSVGNGHSNGKTMDVCNPILVQYADVVNVRSNNDGNHAPAFDGGHIGGGVADKLIKNQEGVCATQSAFVDQVAAAVATIKVPTI